jgi:thiol:disulfide interchange protein
MRACVLNPHVYTLTPHLSTPDLETLHQNGENAVPVDAEGFAKYIAEHEYVFANFYAPWCIWCQVRRCRQRGRWVGRWMSFLCVGVRG